MTITPEIQAKLDDFITGLKAIPWLKPDGKPLPEWRLFPTRTAARKSARYAVNTECKIWDMGSRSANQAVWKAANIANRGDILHEYLDLTLYMRSSIEWDAIVDSTMFLFITRVCVDLPIEQKYREYIVDRWSVWPKGYGILCDIDGVLYVYERIT